MSRTGATAGIVLLVVMLGGAASAQTADPQPTTPPAATRPLDRADLRRHIYVMEGALAKAVEFGAKRLNRELRSVLPEMMALSGAPQARGVFLEGYGVYFDVAVPVLNQMVVLSLRTMLGPDEGVVAAITQLRTFAQNERNPATRAALENAIDRLELQLGPLTGGVSAAPGGAEAVGAAMVTPDAPAVARPKIDKKYVQDPNAVNQAYTESVQEALIDAMIDYGFTITIRPDEFLTVAARDNMHRDTLAPPDPYEEIVTILLRIRGSDLEAYRKGEIDAAEIRRRVQIREW